MTIQDDSLQCGDAEPTSVPDSPPPVPADLPARPQTSQPQATEHDVADNLAMAGLATEKRSVVLDSVTESVLEADSALENSRLEPDSERSDLVETDAAVAFSTSQAVRATRLDLAPSDQQRAVDVETQPQHLAYSTLLSLLVVLILIITIRFTVPPLVESLRYSWHRGQLRAEYEISGQQLKNVSLNSLSEASELVSRRVGPSVVHINLLEVFAPLGQSFLGGDEERVQLVGQGSGVILDQAGHILTNQHVIEGAGRIQVSISDGRTLVAEAVGTDPLTDLAVIKIEADGLMPVEWGDSNKMDVGSPVWAVGSPFGLERTVTFGILSGKHRVDLKGTRYDSRVKGSTTYGDLMQSDVAVNPGNSGGPLVNSSGQIIGINTAIVGETYIGISFSIPSNVARRVAAGLIEEGEVQRGWLGVGLSDPIVADGAEGQLPQRGALVRDWAKQAHSPAKAAGIRPGDIIISYAGEEVANHAALMGLVAQTDIGVTVPIEVLRSGMRMTFDVEIGRRPRELNGAKP